jgi:hypothetical protein
MEFDVGYAAHTTTMAERLNKDRAALQVENLNETSAENRYPDIYG